MSWISKLKLGLSKTSAKIASGIDDIFNKRKLDKELQEAEKNKDEENIGRLLREIQQLLKEYS